MDVNFEVALVHVLHSKISYISGASTPYNVATPSPSVMALENPDQMFFFVFKK